MPVVDSQNHEPAALSAEARADAGPAWAWLAGSESGDDQQGFPRAARGPASRVEFAGGGARWLAARDIPAGEHVTWRCVLAACDVKMLF